ncbi:NAD(P)H-dependent oxidoreductase [Helicobacter saguini]|uniref:NAD(P)H-dependent oxidoreductase n=1 Tax=Helicobacter saguini TaxID=1548018 RepID=A0A347VNC9_9HELI|nr:NAD(P)H-dependent oxidoreductase [Helicobacter saguini]MWV61816.1 NAD(P)H-dependent oxidoreductase [Helicobacter saguini]MWV67509.1 NAD(P)H-dependent oxidoreductase [Helicobacter saguini]MWV69860.1 NAD(P)H-dependent oxidoreductase [Helicobacter saguini]MWV72922.1 NAD(P)H-dependent oxidoreductase [Helicobacter saguini]TLD93274.1 NAD(P)H-dependent oxidoreductase [Helicobacter saguini]
MREDLFLNASKFRFACKVFDKDKKIPCGQWHAILESGRLAPSSFGLEPTRMIVVKSKAAKEAVKKACWEQKQITDASHTIIFTSLKCDMLPGTNYIRNKFARRTKTSEELDYYIKERYGRMKLETLGYTADIEKLGMWSAHQAYIMATAMMYHAAFLKIDSCMIEGFDKVELEKYLQMDTFKEQVSLVLCLGYRAMEQGKRNRMDIHDLVRKI